MTLAKALGGGLPIGVALMRQHVADAIAAGDHAATFGANPVACAAAVVVFNKLIEDGFVQSVKEKASIWRVDCKSCKSGFPIRLRACAVAD